MFKRNLKNILERNLNFLRNTGESSSRTNNFRFNSLNNAIKPNFVYPYFQVYHHI